MTRKRSCPVRRGGIGKVPEQSGNSLVSYSTARPVRERLLKVIHRPYQSVRNPQILSHAHERENSGEREKLCRENRRSRLIQSG